MKVLQFPKKIENQNSKDHLINLAQVSHTRLEELKKEIKKLNDDQDISSEVRALKGISNQLESIIREIKDQRIASKKVA